MNNQNPLRTRIRWVAAVLMVSAVVSGLIWLFVPSWRLLAGGWFIGTLGGGIAVGSMFRQGHANDDLQGPMLMVSGVIGYFTRLIALAFTMLVAAKLHVNVYASLAGYLLGFAVLIIALYGYARK